MTTQKFHGGTIFCDAASGRFFVVHQVGLTACETVQAKLCFESDAATIGVSVLKYSTDMGVYTSHEFAAALAAKG